MEKRVMAIAGLGAILLLPAPGRGELVVEWWGKADACRHKSMTIEAGDAGDLLKFDLGPLAPGTKIYHASLRAHTRVIPPRTDKRAYMNIGRGVFYYDPLSLYAEKRPSRPVLIYADPDDKRPLRLEPPQFKSFDATEAVRAWVSGKRPNRGFLVKRFDNWTPGSTVLEVRYEGKVADPPRQASGLKAVHRKGQTFLTWIEIEKIITKEKVLWSEFEATFKEHSGPRQDTFYRIYRSDKPITAANLAQAERIDEIWPLSGYDARLHQHVVRGENWIGLDPDVWVARYCVTDPPAGTLPPTGEYRGRKEWRGKQLPLHTGLYVHQPGKAGKAYYAVTVIAGGVENTRDLTAANSLAEPVAETVAAGEPILYRWLNQDTGPRRKRIPRETQFFVYWAAPPYANQPRRPIHVQVGLVGPTPGPKLRARWSMRAMYGNEIIRGTHAREWRDHDRVLTVICDASFMTDGYWESWNTLRPMRDPSKRQPYSKRLVELLTGWAGKLRRRAPLEDRE